MTHNTMYDTTSNGTRYKFVDSNCDEVLLVDGYAYSVGNGSRYNCRDFEVAGFEIGGTVEDCQVSEDGNELFSGTELECWNYVIERLGTPNSGWAGFEGDFYKGPVDGIEDESHEDEDEMAD